MITRINEDGGLFYPQVMFKLFWLIPTGWWRNCVDLHYDIIDGEYVDTVKCETKQDAAEYINSL